MGALETEVRDIPGYEGVYAATADGRIWSYPRTWLTARHIHRKHDGKWLATFPDSRGYIRVNLKRGGKAKSVHVHRLVALAWIPNPFSLPEVNHMNGVKGENRRENLEWCTASQNSRHAHRTGLVNLNTPAFLASVRRNVLKAHAATRGRKRA